MTPQICVVGGIYDKPSDYRSRHKYTPETILGQGLRDAGFRVVEIGHRDFRPKDEYDIVHVHHLGRAALRMATAASRSRFVLTIHGLSLMHKDTYSRKTDIMSKFIIGQADSVVALSSVERRFLQMRGLASAELIQVIPNGVPTGVFFPTMPRRPDNPAPILLFVGQLIPLKGVDVLLQSFAEVAATRHVQLNLVYQNPDQEHVYIRIAHELGIAGNVSFLGFRSTDEIGELYRRSDILVLPSLSESLPSVITEAMLSGIPVVASDVGAVSEQLAGHGIVVPARNAHRLANAIKSVLDDIDAFRTKATDAIAYARDRFSTEAMISSHKKLYDAILSEGAPPRRLTPFRAPLNIISNLLLRMTD